MYNKAQGETDEQVMAGAIKNEKIRRVMLAGPSVITGEATVAEMDKDGQMIVLRPGTNDWVCVPGPFSRNTTAFRVRGVAAPTPAPLRAG